KLVRVGKGKFTMGSPKDEEDRGADEAEREVEIPHDFYLGVHEVTQGEWVALMKDNPSHFSRTGAGKESVKDVSDADLARFPVEMVSHDDVMAFVERLNEREKDKLRGWRYSLPTEAEWEYACRGGASSSREPFHFTKPCGWLSPEQANFWGS